MALPVSFEFFPPKTPEGAEKLRAVRQQLYGQKPEFCSVTYGAGGSTQQGTFDTVGAILAEGVDAASHFSCIGATSAPISFVTRTCATLAICPTTECPFGVISKSVCAVCPHYVDAY